MLRFVALACLAPLAACAGPDGPTERTTEATATLEENASAQGDAPASSSSTEEVRAPGDGAEGDEAADWIERRWPALGSARDALARSDLDAARAHLTAWIAPGLSTLVADLDDEQRLELAHRVDALAGALSAPGVQLEAREVALVASEALYAPESSSVLHARVRLAGAAFQVGDVPRAHGLYDAVHATLERLHSADHPRLVEAKQNLAATSYRSGDLARARELYEDLHAVWTASLPSDHASLLGAKRFLAGLRRSMGDLDGARVLYEELRAAWEGVFPPDHPDLLDVERKLGSVRFDLGDHEGARRSFELVLDALEGRVPAEHPDLLGARLNLALVQRAEGALEEALVVLDDVHTIAERVLPAGHPNLLLVESNRSNVLLELGHFERAHAGFERVLAAREASLPAGHPELLDARRSCAGSLFRLGDLAGALQLYEQVHAECTANLAPDHPSLLAAKHDLAVARSALGDRAGALELLEEVHGAWERVVPEDHPDLVGAKQGLAVALRDAGRIDRAHELNAQVYAVLERSLDPGHPDLLLAMQNLALTRRDTGDLEGARELEERVLAAREASLWDGHPDLLAARQNLASTLSDLGDLEGARRHYEEVRAWRLATLPADHPDLLDAHLNLAGILFELGEVEELGEVLVEALSGQRAATRSTARLAPRVARSFALRELERLRWLTHFGTAAGPGSTDGLAAALLETLESLRATSVVSAEFARASASSPELAEAVAAVARARRRLADASHPSSADRVDTEAWRRELFRLSQERDALESELRRLATEAGIEPLLVSTETIADALAADEALVSFWRQRRYGEEQDGGYAYTDGLLAFVTTSDRAVHLIDLGPADLLDERVTRWRTSLGRPVDATRGIGLEEVAADADRELATGRALRRALLDPIVDHLAGRGVRTLHVIPDSMLHLVPLDALPGEGGARFGDAVAVRVHPSVAPLLRVRSDLGRLGAFLAVGSVDYGAREIARADSPASRPNLRGGVGDFELLTATGPEARRAAALFDEHVGDEVVLLVGDAASEAALIARAPGSRFVHIATHGWFVDQDRAVSMQDGVERTATDPWRSDGRTRETIVGFLPETLCGLALAGANHGADGRMTAEELATLDLTNCELAVLSACETNVGIRRAGQGIQSLQTALHAAGARTAITSLWQVDDAATMRLFELFYTGLWKDGLGKADALWQAKMALRDEGYEVRDWAGWVLTGDPD